MFLFFKVYCTAKSPVFLGKNFDKIIAFWGVSSDDFTAIEIVEQYDKTICKQAIAEVTTPYDKRATQIRRILTQRLPCSK